MKPRKMSFSKMDPSCTFGFYLKSEADLRELSRLSESMGPHKIFELLDGTKEDYLLLVHDPSVKVWTINCKLFLMRDSLDLCILTMSRIQKLFLTHSDKNRGINYRAYFH